MREILKEPVQIFQIWETIFYIMIKRSRIFLRCEEIFSIIFFSVEYCITTGGLVLEQSRFHINFFREQIQTQNLMFGNSPCNIHFLKSQA